MHISHLQASITAVTVEKWQKLAESGQKLLTEVRYLIYDTLEVRYLIYDTLEVRYLIYDTSTSNV